MTIKRLHHNHTDATDSIVSGRSPIKAEDPPGFFLGVHPAVPQLPLCITYWEAVELAQKLGLPSPEQYEEQKAHTDALERKVADLETALVESVHDLQFAALTKEFRKNHKETLNAVEGILGAVRSRLGADGTDARPAAKPAGTVRAAAGK